MIGMKYAQLDSVTISRFKNYCGIFKLKYKRNYNNYYEPFRRIAIKYYLK